jgi:hypothetical protein
MWYVSMFLRFIDIFLWYVDGNDIPTSVILAQAGIHVNAFKVKIDSRLRENDKPKTYSPPANACCKSDFFNSSRHAILRW